MDPNLKQIVQLVLDLSWKADNGYITYEDAFGQVLGSVMKVIGSEYTYQKNFNNKGA